MLKNELTEQDKINHWQNLYNKILDDFSELQEEFKKLALFNELLINDNKQKSETIRQKNRDVLNLEKTIQDLQINISREINKNIKN